jgi:hypothetical protein
MILIYYGANGTYSDTYYSVLGVGVVGRPIHTWFAPNAAQVLPQNNMSPSQPGRRALSPRESALCIAERVGIRRWAYSVPVRISTYGPNLSSIFSGRREDARERDRIS